MISVVIPALNEAEYIARCLESVKAQDYRDFEIIVVDNGSTDATAEIAAGMGARVIACTGPGVAAARQAGADVARGEIIIQADADTIYPRQWLARVMRDFTHHPKAIAVAGRYTYIDPPVWSFVEYFFRIFFNWLSILLVGRPVVISGANFAFYRRTFIAAGGYRDCMYADQFELATRLAKLGGIVYDRRLCVVTSARRVQKPLSVVIMDCLAHIARTTRMIVAPAVSDSRIALRRMFSFRATPKYALALLVIGYLAYGYFIPTSQVFGKVYYKANTGEKVVALTFDDGPNEPYTSEVLDILKQYDVKATFFVVGKNVEKYPQTVNRMIAEGHVIGNHSYSHKANHALTDLEGKDIQRAQAAIFAVAGVMPYLYRPPHGKKSPNELSALREQNLVEVMWNVSTNEQHKTAFFGKPVPALVARDILSEVKPGKIMLLHDGYGTDHISKKADRSLTVETLPIIIESLQAQGYVFVTVPELLGVPSYN